MGIFNIFKKPPSKNARQPPKLKRTSKAAPKKQPAASLRRPTVPWGRTLSTLDNLTSGSKTGSKKPRPLVVIDNNKKNDLAVVGLTTTPGKDRTNLPKYQNGRSYFKHYVETTDNSGNPIRVNDKFRANHKNMDVSKNDIEKIRETVLTKSRMKNRNIKKIDELKK